MSDSEDCDDHSNYILQPRTYRVSNSTHLDTNIALRGSAQETPSRPILKPKSQKAKAARKIVAGVRDIISALSSYDQPSAKRAVRISKTPSVEFIKGEVMNR
jgi:hypothetical protein